MPASAIIVSVKHLSDHDPLILRVVADGEDMPSRSLDVPVSGSSRVIEAEYADFELVRPFVRTLLQLRPASLRFDYLCNVTADLCRFALAMGIPVSVSEGVENVAVGQSAADRRWAGALLDALEGRGAASQPADSKMINQNSSAGYEAYAFSSRNHRLLVTWAERVLPHFVDRERVLDLGCGTGVFLDQLARRDIPARGVDSDRASVAYAQLLGLEATLMEGSEYLGLHPDEFDAVHCSHLIEHLPFSELGRAMRLIAGALHPGGRAVFVFPDPESIRSQLLGFWRDPDHERFYHPDTIIMMADAAGLALESNSLDRPGRFIAPFSDSPPGWAPAAFRDYIRGTGEPFDVPPSDDDTQVQLAYLRAAVQRHEDWLARLWAVNQTWAWEDDAVVTFIKQ